MSSLTSHMTSSSKDQNVQLLDALIRKNNYTNEGLIGVGNFAWVYRIRHTITNQQYAGKAYYISNLSTRQNIPINEVLIIINNEIDVMNKLVFVEYVVRFREAIKNDTMIVIVMELCPDFTLEQLIRDTNSNQGLDDNMILFLFKQLLYGLYEIHRLNVLHRDLKPANLFLITTNNKNSNSQEKNHQYILKIGDLGFSYVLNDGRTSLESAVSVACTSRYLSPEVKFNSSSQSLKSDVWSVGVILIDMIFGFNNLYDDDLRCRNNIEIIESELRSKKKNVNFLRIIKCCLEREKDRRKDIADVIRAVDETFQISNDFLHITRSINPNHVSVNNNNNNTNTLDRKQCTPTTPLHKLSVSKIIGMLTSSKCNEIINVRLRKRKQELPTKNPQSSPSYQSNHSQEEPNNMRNLFSKLLRSGVTNFTHSMVDGIKNKAKDEPSSRMNNSINSRKNRILFSSIIKEADAKILLNKYKIGSKDDAHSK